MLDNTEFNTKSFSFLDMLSDAQNLYWLFGILFIAFIAITYIIRFRKRVNTLSERQIEYFVHSGKYIKDLFIELNNTKEVLRYFVFSTHWKGRIIKAFNQVYKTYDGKLLISANRNPKLSFRLPLSASCSRIMRVINQHKGLFIKWRETQEREAFSTEYEERLLKIGWASGYFCDYFDDLMDKYRAMLCNNILLTGSAGNGKTNLLCSIAELIISTKNACIFINSRDMRDNAESEFTSRLCIPKALQHHWWFVLKLNCFFLRIQRKKLFVLIDAINENDDPLFKESLVALLNKLSGVHGVKIALTCRSEYFEERFSDTIFKLCPEPYSYSIKSTEYSNRAKIRMQRAYATHFNFTGKLSDKAGNQVLKSLLLLRMFYESYSNLSDTILTLNKYTVFQKYIEILKSATNVNIEYYIESLAHKMIEQMRFDGVLTACLDLSASEVQELKIITDGNILISRNIRKNEGSITQKSEEICYFVFDEMRDYCLARVLITDCEQASKYDNLFNFLDKLQSNTESPLEGIVNYSYYYFRKRADIEHCKMLLKNYTEVKAEIAEKARWKLHGSQFNEFHFFAATMILDVNEPLLDFEKAVLFYCVKQFPEDMLLFFKYLIPERGQEIIHPFSLINELIFSLDKLSQIRYVLKKFGEDSNDYYLCDTYANLCAEDLILYYNCFSNEDDRSDYALFLIILALVKYDLDDLIDMVAEKQDVRTIMKKVAENAACKDLASFANTFLNKPQENTSILNFLKEMFDEYTSENRL